MNTAHARRQLKEAYGLEYLEFYVNGNKYHCKYVSDPDTAADSIDIHEFSVLMNMLSLQQCYVFFDDVGEICIGLDGLKEKYLIFKLAGL